MKKLFTVSFLTFGIILISGCSLTEEKPVDNSAMIERKQDTMNTDIEFLEKKWSNEGFLNWQEKDFILQDSNIIIPDNVIISTNQNGISEINKSIAGTISVKGIESCRISINKKIAEELLEKWIQKIWRDIIVENDCSSKNLSSTKTLTNGKTWKQFCEYGPTFENKINNNIIRWNSSYISSPSIISTVVKNNIINIECGQDYSGFTIELIEDIIASIKSNS